MMRSYEDLTELARNLTDDQAELLAEAYWDRLTHISGVLHHQPAHSAVPWPCLHAEHRAVGQLLARGLLDYRRGCWECTDEGAACVLLLRQAGRVWAVTP